MKANNCKKVIFKSLLVGILLPSFLTFAFTKQNPSRVNAFDETENVLYENYFNQDSDGFDDVVVENQVGVVTTANGWAHIPTPLVNSNNYEIALDVKSSSNFYIHLHGLDASHEGWSIYLAAEGGGAYWSLRRQFEGDGFYCVYNNSGKDQGGLDDSTADYVNSFANVKLIHIDGYLEVFVNDVRRVVTHLDTFGNNTNGSSSGRTAITEGEIDYIAICSSGSRTTVIDNVVVKEAKKESSFYSFNSNYDSSNYNATDILSLSAYSLDYEYFVITGEWEIFDTTYSTYYFPRMVLYGLNASLTQVNGRSYGLVCQSDHSGAYSNPAIYYQTDGSTDYSSIKKGDPTGETPGDYAVLVNNVLKIRFECYGDHFKYYCNDVLCVDQTFTALGITKGKLQYVSMISGGGKAFWKSLTYNGFNSHPGVMVEAENNEIVYGENAVVYAATFGAGSDFEWTIDGNPTGVSDTEYVISDLNIGSHVISYGNNDYLASTTVNVIGKRIVISSDKTSIGLYESATFTATIYGDFSGETFNWYIDEEKQLESSTTFVVSSLMPGTYEICYKTESTSSNVIMLNVLSGTISISSEKATYYPDNIAIFNATTSNIQTSDTINWFVNNSKQEGLTGEMFALSLSQFGIGSLINIQAITDSGIASNILPISIAFDAFDSLKKKEEYEELYKLPINPDNTYGTFDVESDYLTSHNSNPAYTLSSEQTVKKLENLFYTFEYKIFVPTSYNIQSYVYPTFKGIDTNYPDGEVEIALGINGYGITPYIKDNAAGKEYYPDKNGFNVNLNFGGGVVNKGNWIQVTVAFYNNSIAYYLNEELSLFTTFANMGLPTSIRLNMWTGDSSSIPLRMKDIDMHSVGGGTAAIEGVVLSASKIVCSIKETITITACLTPYNARYATITWYMNGEIIENENKETFMFSPKEIGTYIFKVDVDGIESEEKSIIVKESTSDLDDNSDKQDNRDAWFFILIISVIGAGIIAFVIYKAITKRKISKL